MKKPVFEGLATAIVTPFKNGTIDIPTFEMLLDTQLAANVDAIVVCGTTGESTTLSAQEQLALIAHAIQYTAGRCKIIAGTGSQASTRSSCKTPLPMLVRIGRFTFIQSPAYAVG